MIARLLFKNRVTPTDVIPILYYIPGINIRYKFT